MSAMTPTEFLGVVPVDGYGPGFFRVGGVVHHGAILVTAEGVTPWAGLEDTAPLLALAGKVDVLFMGMGTDVAFPPAALRDALDAVGIMAEPMNSPSAARSYNVTLAEGRRVACALLPV
ncbi:Mth938-like domain-containing protein [Paracoccus sp. CPCC 101403]|uniref:Mth938-like domain-containing protein n=2 Tax=Paracoccus broussonetiae TaxID=3075834 RepID=A0ABU3EJS3_9RHOB|nr:Mth938-like domain-containing protein [Paracoccus sp. CPCC 101403]MDT1064479.1 Mth938-like domain-containing protein [Paracoccus sp. CPCC 101403]